MANLLDNILLPVASEEDAVATAQALSNHDFGTVTAVHVIEKAGGGIDKAGVEQREEEAATIFEALQDELGQSVKTDILYGTDVADTIFAAADEIDATSVVITPRGGSRWIQLLTGDVALSLVTESDRPVVVLPDSEAEVVEDE